MPKILLIFILLVGIYSCQPGPGGNSGAGATTGSAGNEQNSLTAPDEEESSADPFDLNYRPPADTAAEIVDVPNTGINLGWGWDRTDAEPVPGVCIEFEEAQEPAQTRFMTMKEVSDSYELMKSMGMSAQASVKTIGFEVSGKASFAKETNITGFSSNFVMNASVENGVRYTAPAESPENYRSKTGHSQGKAIRLTPHAEKLALDDIDEFRHQCGDSYVSAVYAGAKLTAVITIETKSQKEQEELSAELSGSGWGARFEASMNQKSGTKTENKSMSMSIFQTGGRGDAIPTNKDQLLEKLELLSAIAFDAPKDFHMAITPYEALSNWPAQPLIVNESEYEQLASFWGAYNTLYDEIEYVLENPADFTAISTSGAPKKYCAGFKRTGDYAQSLRPLQIQRLERVQDDVLDALQRLRGFAAYCATTEDVCVFPEDKFRSPFAYRIQLPLPLLTPEPTKEEVAAEELEEALKKKLEGLFGSHYKPLISEAPESYSIDTLTYSHVFDPAKRRCQSDKSDPLCLSNAEIGAWRDKIGLSVLKFDSLAARDTLLTTLRTLELNQGTQSCDTDETKPVAFIEEPGFPAIWYHPTIKKCLDNADASCLTS